MNSKLLAVLISLSVGLNAQNVQNAKSRVTGAVVFKSSAQVTRTAEVNLVKGVQQVCFSNLTTDMVDQSVGITANKNDNIKILDVMVNRKMTTETQQEKIKLLEHKIDSLNALRNLVDVDLGVLTGTREFIESIRPQQVPQQKSVQGVQPDYSMFLKEWAGAMSHLDDELAKTQDAIRAKTLRIARIQDEIAEIHRQITNSSGVVSHDFKEIIVTLEAGRKQRATLSASYIVPNAKWFPLYDARVNSGDKINELSYYGMLQQSTGEDWNDIDLTLSTAEPKTTKSLPHMDNWFIDLRPIPVRRKEESVNTNGNSLRVTYEQNWGLPASKGAITGYVTDIKTGEMLKGANVVIEGTSNGAQTGSDGKFYIANIPVGTSRLRISYIGYHNRSVDIVVLERNTASATFPLYSKAIASSEVMVMADRPLINKNATNANSITSDSQIQSVGGSTEERKPREREKYTNIFANDLATNFVVPAKYSIPSDKDVHKVTIAIEEMKIDFEHATIPKLNPRILLKGKIGNKNNYPWLGGEVNIFVDSDFLNKTTMKTIVSGDSLDLTLGSDDLMRVERVLANRKKEGPALFGNKISVTFEYELRLSNNRKTEETLVISDQLPISSSEDIIVEPIEPFVVLKDLNREHKIEWRVTLKPGERKTVPFKFKVSYPKEMSGVGI